LGLRGSEETDFPQSARGCKYATKWAKRVLISTVLELAITYANQLIQLFNQFWLCKHFPLFGVSSP
jgi:hypothetical protein